MNMTDTLDLTCPETTMTVLLADDDLLDFAVTDENDLMPAGSMAGVEFTFVVVPSQYSSDDGALISKTNADMEQFLDNDAWIGTIPISAADKADLSVGTYYYRLRMVESDDTPTTIRRGPYVVAG